MTQIEKVKQGLRACRTTGAMVCAECPYCEKIRFCAKALNADALSVINELSGKVEQLEAEIAYLRAGSSDRPQR